MRSTMGDDCTRWEIEIAAAAGGELRPEVRAHVEGCPRCERFAAAASSLARHAGPAAATSPGRALALARGSRRGSTRRGTPLWALPLLSASASAAALILHFGLASPAAPGAEAAFVSDPGVSSGLAEPTRTGALGAARTASLPPSLRAASELLLSRREEER